jgi:hypothetical protein
MVLFFFSCKKKRHQTKQKWDGFGGEKRVYAKRLVPALFRFF